MYIYASFCLVYFFIKLKWNCDLFVLDKDFFLQIVQSANWTQLS